AVVPSLRLRNSGRTPIPSGSMRINSSSPPGRSVGLTHPTTPRQLVNAMVALLPYPAPAAWIGFAAGSRFQDAAHTPEAAGYLRALSLCWMGTLRTFQREDVTSSTLPCNSWI